MIVALPIYIWLMHVHVLVYVLERGYGIFATLVQRAIAAQDVDHEPVIHGLSQLLIQPFIFPFLQC